MPLQFTETTFSQWQPIISSMRGPADVLCAEAYPELPKFSEDAKWGTACFYVFGLRYLLSGRVISRVGKALERVASLIRNYLFRPAIRESLT